MSNITEQQMKIKFKDLSLPLKFSIVGGMLFIGWLILTFSIGFIIGFLEGLIGA